MRLAFLALVLTLPASASALPADPPPASADPHRVASGPTPSRICGDLRVRLIRSPDGAKPKRLGELPSGDLTLSVLNRVGDCIEPVIVRQGYGLGGR